MVPDYLRSEYKDSKLDEASFARLKGQILEGKLDRWILTNQGSLVETSKLGRIWEGLKCLGSFNRTSHEAVAFQAMRALDYAIEQGWVQGEEEITLMKNAILSSIDDIPEMKQALGSMAQMRAPQTGVEGEGPAILSQRNVEQKANLDRRLHTLLSRTLPFWCSEQAIEYAITHPSPYEQIKVFLSGKPERVIIDSTLPALIQNLQSVGGKQKAQARELLLKAFIQNKEQRYCIAAATLGDPCAKAVCMLGGFGCEQEYGKGCGIVSGSINKLYCYFHGIQESELYAAAGCCCVLKRKEMIETQMRESGGSYDVTQYTRDLIDMFLRADQAGVDVKSLSEFFKKEKVWSLLAYAAMDTTDLMQSFKDDDRNEAIAAFIQRGNAVINAEEIKDTRLLEAVAITNPKGPISGQDVAKAKIQEQAQFQPTLKFSRDIQLTVTKNVPQGSVLTSAGKKTYLDEINKQIKHLIQDGILSPKQDLVLDIPFFLIDGGICHGIGKSFALQALKIDFNADNFEVQLIEAARKFESGADVDAIAYQITHACLPLIGTVKPSDFLAGLEQEISPEAYKALILELDRHIPIDKRDREWDEVVEEARNNPILIDNLSLEDQASVNELRDQILQEGWGQKKHKKLSEKLSELETPTFRSIQVMTSKSTKQIAKINSVASRVGHGLLYRAGKHVYKNANMKTKFLPFFKAATGEDKIRELARGVDGFYEVSLKTVPGHEVTLVKRGDQLYLFDPNLGLLRFDREHPEQTMRQVLEKYRVYYTQGELYNFDVKQIIPKS
jgi:hypothetical protein